MSKESSVTSGRLLMLSCTEMYRFIYSIMLHNSRTMKLFFVVSPMLTGCGKKAATLNRWRVWWLCGPLQYVSCGPGSDQEFLMSDSGQIFKIFWLRIVHFGLVWLWYVIRQLRIDYNFCVHSGRFARSAAYPHFLRGLKHGTVLNLFGIFSAMAWNFIAKCCTFIWSLVLITRMP